MKTSPPDRIFIAELESDSFPAEASRTVPERTGSRLQACVAQTPALLPLPTSTGPRQVKGGRSGSRTFRVTSTIGGVAAGLALIAYSERLFNTNAIVPSSTTSVPLASIPGVPPPASAEAARTAIPLETVKTASRPAAASPRPVAAVKKRPAGSTRSTGANRSSTVRPVLGAERPRRRNFLGLRTVAGWITGSKADRSDKRDRKSPADKATASAR
jgi:hypothetical protein